MGPVFGDSSVVDALLFGVPTQSTVSFVQREFERFSNTAVGEFGQRLVAETKTLLDRFTNSTVMNMAQAALNQIRSIGMADTIYRFDRMQDFQIAQPMMQTFIMANPMVRKRYHEQRCDGYSDTYVDKHPGKIGKDHVHWQMVNNGLVTEETDGSVSWTNYSGAFTDEGGLHLQPVQAHSVLSTWRSLEKLFAEGEFDPTSPWNGKL